MVDKPNQVQVQIFGQTYSVRAGADPSYVERLAAHVDAQMREVSRSSGAVDTLRIAVLAALNIAEELFRERRNGSGAGTSDVDERLRGLIGRIEEITGTGSPREKASSGR